MPPESLASITHLLHAASNPSPSLAPLLHQRTLALLHLQRAVRHLTTQRDSLGALLAAHVTATEDSLHLKSARKPSRAGAAAAAGAKKDTEGAFLDRYEKVVAEFERRWEDGIKDFSKPEASAETRPSSWLEELGDEQTEHTVPEVLEILVSDPYTLGAGIATLEGAALTSLIPSPNSSTTDTVAPPLETLIKLLVAAHGPDAALSLALGTFEMATREIVGRESSAANQADPPAGVGLGLGLGLGIGMAGEEKRPPTAVPAGGGRAREKELEGFLVEMLELLDGLGLLVEGRGPPPSSGSATGGTGPLSLHRGVEDILLNLLHAAKALRAPAASPRAASSALSTSPSRDSPTSTWSSTFTNTVSTLSSYPIAGLYSAANALPSSPLPTYSPYATPPPPHEHTPPRVPPKPFSSPTSFPSFIPSSPSQFLSPPKPTSPLATLLTRSAAALLRALTPSGSSAPTPLPQVLIATLLSTSFPSQSATTAHRKVLLLAVTRWWAFGWLGRKLGRSAYGGAWSATGVPSGVQLATAADEELGAVLGATTAAGTALLDEVYVSSGETVELMLGLHRAVYSAVVAACGLSGGGGSEDVASPVMEGDRDKRSLRNAAKAFVAAWSSPSSTAPRANEAISPNSNSLTAFGLSSDEFLTLVDSFAPLVVHGPATGSSSPRPPSSRGGRRSSASAASLSSPPATTFKRSSAFGSTSSPVLGGDGMAGGQAESGWRTARDGAPKASLSERLETVQLRLQEMPSEGDADLAVFYASQRYDEASASRIRIKSRLPPSAASTPSSPELQQTPTTDPSPPTVAPSLSRTATARPPLNRSYTSPPLETIHSGWISPPRSPRQEALQHSMGSGSAVGYFPPLGATSPPAFLAPHEDPFISLTSSFTAGWDKPKLDAASTQGQDVSAAEMELLRRGVFALARSSSGRGRAQRGSGSAEVVAALQAASARTAAERNYPSHVLFSQTLAVLEHLRQHSVDLDELLGRIAAPLREAYRRGQEEKELTSRRIEEVALQRVMLLDLARAERGLLDDLRTRAWYSSIKGSTLGCQLRSRLAEVHHSRTDVEKEQARAGVEAWRKDLGVYSFINAEESTFDESLMLVETAVAISMQPATLYASRFWAREGKVVASLVAQRSPNMTHPPSTFAESLLASGSSILSAPLSLAGLPTTASPLLTDLEGPADVVLSFGAASPALLKPREASTAFAGAVEEHLLRLQLKLAAYLWSDLSSNLISTRDAEGRLCGCDAWFEEFASPLSPLSRPEARELREGVKAVPKAYLPSPESAPPPKYLVELLQRFARHPSPHAKMHALLELELVLSAMMGAPASAQAVAPSLSSTEGLASVAGGKGYLSKLSGLLPARTKRMSLSPSPITKLLDGAEGEGAEPFTVDFGGTPVLSLSSDNPRRRSTSTRSRPLSSSAASMSSTSDFGGGASLLPSLLDFSSPATTAAGSTTGQPANTDALLLTLESLLLHTLPSLQPGLFQSLQLIASLTPSSILDCHVLGKAFWDVAGAALSVKREVVEGPWGIVERATRALSEGTEEARELAERLVRIAAREESAVALGLLGSMGLQRP